MTTEQRQMDVAPSPGTLSHQQLAGMKNGFSLRAPGGSKVLRDDVSVVGSHSVCAELLGLDPQDPKAGWLSSR